MNVLDRVVTAFSPARGFRRQQYRRIMAYYEGAQPSRLRGFKGKGGTANQAVDYAGAALRNRARSLERNYDLARGALSALVRNVVGAKGIVVEPQPRLRNGQVHTDFARQLSEQYAIWMKKPEVTEQYDYAGAQRLLCRSWLRDGEVFSQLVMGSTKKIVYRTRVPLSLEMIECDLLPLSYTDPSKQIIQGVQLNGWGSPRRYFFYQRLPADLYQMDSFTNMRSIPARRVIHAAMRDRIGQVRGVSLFASALDRLTDVKDYEESERIAAKVAASMAAVIKKGAPDMYQPDLAPEQRELKFAPGMIFDDLLLGETVETIDAKRPNPGMEAFRQGQLRAIAAGLDTSYSTLSRDYNGTYSAQRQELVEQWSAYAVLSAEFFNSVVRRVYEAWIRLAILTGTVKVPAGINPETIDDVSALAPQMPWIDPLKEALSWTALERAGYASGIEIVRRRGQNPADVVEQERRWKEMLATSGITPDLAPTKKQPRAEGDESWQQEMNHGGEA